MNILVRTTCSRTIKKLIIFAVLFTTYFQSLLINAQPTTKSYDMVVSIKHKDFTYLYGNNSGSPVRYIDYKVNNSGQEVFCLDRDKPSPDGVGFTQEEKVSKGINYIVTNFFETKEYLTGDAKKDFYITQMAIRLYQDGGSDEHLRDAQGNYYSDPEGVIPRILNVVKKAKNEGLEVPIFTNSIEVTSEDSVFHKNGDVFETGIYTLNVKGNLNSYDVSITGAPEGTEVIKLSNNRFRLRTNASNIQETTYDVEINVAGKFINEYKFATYYLSSDSEVQDVTTLATYRENENVSTKANATFRLSGTVEIQKIDKETFTPLVGAKFTIFKDGNEIGSVTTGEDGKASLGNLPYGDYEAKEVQAPNGYILDGNVHPFRITEDDQIVKITAPNRPVLGKIEVIKHDAETGKNAQGEATLDGAIFEVYDSSGQIVDTLTIKDGKAVTKDLQLGTYTIKEISAPKGYLLNEEIYTVELKYEGQNVEVVSKSETITNDVIKGKISLLKIGDVGILHNSIKPTLKDVEFTIFDSKGTEVAKIITDENGHAETPLLPYGTYTVSETKRPAGYKAIEDFEVVINENNKTYFYVVENEAFRADLQIVKKDMETGKTIPAEGITFKIKNVSTGEWVEQTVTYPTNEKISEFQTASDGTVNLPEPLTYGDYEIHEVKAPNGYVLSNKPIPFSVTEENGSTGQKITIEFPNMAQQGTIHLSKAGDKVAGVTSRETIHGDLFEFVFEQKLLAGVEFELIAAEDIVTGDGTVRHEKGTVVERIVTGEDGNATSSSHYLGKYQLIEVLAPKGYVLTGQKYDVELTYEGQEVEITSTSISVENDWQELRMELEKHSEDDIALENVVYGIYNAEDIIVNEEVILEAGSLVGLTTTDENGQGEIVGHYPEMEFFAQELETIPNYVVDDTKHSFVYEVNNNDEVHELSISKDPFVNVAQKGTINIKKTGDMLTDVEMEETKFGNKYNFVFEQKPLAGVTFEVKAAEDIYTLDGKMQYEKGTVVDTVTTEEDGTISTNLLHLGKYQLIEIEAPEGYVLTDQIYEVELVYAGQDVEITSTDISIENTLQGVELSLFKVAEIVTGWSDGSFETEMQATEGITFGIFLREELQITEENVVPSDSLIALVTTDKEGIAKVIEQFPEGKYYARELQTTTEHILLTDEYDFEVVYEDNQEKNIIHLFEDEALENHLKCGKVEITKVDADTKEALADAELTVTKDGEEVAMVVTGEDGTASLELPYGVDYKVVESRAPGGYILEETAFEFSITEDDQIVKITVENEKEVQKVLPQTGESSALPIVILGLSVIAVGIALFIRTKNKEVRSPIDK